MRYLGIDVSKARLEFSDASGRLAAALLFAMTLVPRRARSAQAELADGKADQPGYDDLICDRVKGHDLGPLPRR